jgi:L-threonylcarbamoyladenylate synthase
MGRVSTPDDSAVADPGYQLFDCTTGDPDYIAAAVDAAGAAIERGECIVLPTDTVYGIGADAFDPAAVQRLLDAKMRGRDMPPPVLIGEPALIRALTIDVPQQAKDLVARHWPGPLTVICRMQPSLRMDLGDAEGTIALRVPDHELARQVLRRTGPIAVSSANISGLPASVTCQQAVEQLAESVAVYLDGGALGGADAAPSTIVDFTRSADGEILRRGALSVDVIRDTLPDVADLAEETVEVESEDVIEQPADVEAEDVIEEPDDTETDDIVNAEVVDDQDREPADVEAEDAVEQPVPLLDASRTEETEPQLPPSSREDGASNPAESTRELADRRDGTGTGV